MQLRSLRIAPAPVLARVRAGLEANLPRRLAEAQTAAARLRA